MHFDDESEDSQWCDSMDLGVAFPNKTVGKFQKTSASAQPLNE